MWYLSPLEERATLKMITNLNYLPDFNGLAIRRLKKSKIATLSIFDNFVAQIFFNGDLENKRLDVFTVISVCKNNWLLNNVVKIRVSCSEFRFTSTKTIKIYETFIENNYNLFNFYYLKLLKDVHVLRHR